MEHILSRCLVGCYVLYITMFRLSAALEALSIIRSRLIGLSHSVIHESRAKQTGHKISVSTPQ